MEWPSYLVDNLTVSDLNDWDPGNLDVGQGRYTHQLSPSTNAGTVIHSGDQRPSYNNRAQYPYALLDFNPLESAAWTQLGLYDFESNGTNPPTDDTAQTTVPSRISSEDSTSRATPLAPTVPIPKAPMSTVNRNSRAKGKVPNGQDRNHKQKHA